MVNYEMFEEQLERWCEKVKRVAKYAETARTDMNHEPCMIDTYHMMKDVDEIISDYFDRISCIEY